MKVCDKFSCSFNNWYPKFQKWTIKSEMVPIPINVLRYLKSDIVMVPVEALVETKKTSEIDDVTYTTWEESDDDNYGDDDDDDDLPPPSFPEFSEKLKNAMEKLGGKVFIKLNWSAPYDAAWIATNNSLKCSNLQDIYLLLKGSCRVCIDLDWGPSIKNMEYCVVLRKWEDIHPGSEFRCFIKDSELIAITQRDKSEFHKHISQNKIAIVKDIQKFYNQNIRSQFILTNYIFDVIWNISKVKLVDFNTFDDYYESYLFKWPELKSMEYVEGVSPEFRYIGEDVGIQPVNLDRHFGMPSDLTDMPLETSRSIIELIQNNIDLQTREKEENQQNS